MDYYNNENRTQLQAFDFSCTSLIHPQVFRGAPCLNGRDVDQEEQQESHSSLAS